MEAPMVPTMLRAPQARHPTDPAQKLHSEGAKDFHDNSR